MGDALDSLREQKVVPVAGDWRYGRIYSRTQIFEAWLILERSETGWLTEIRKIPCPRKLDCDTDGGLKNPDESIWKNPGNANPEHGDAVYEMRSRPTPGGHANQCSYDIHGEIMTGIPEGGTTDFAAHALPNFIPHYLHDYRPWKLAEILNRRDDYQGNVKVNLVG